MMPSAVAPDQMMARLSGTQPELTGITNSLKTVIRSRSRLFARLVSGQITGTVIIVVTTTHQLANLSSLSWPNNYPWLWLCTQPYLVHSEVLVYNASIMRKVKLAIILCNSSHFVITSALPAPSHASTVTGILLKSIILLCFKC